MAAGTGRPTLTIVGGASAVPPAGAAAVLWDSVDDDGRHLSLPRELDRHFERCQEVFVRWRDSLGRMTVGGSCLVDALAGPGPGPGSPWWATALPTTPGEDLPAVADILKLMLLEERYSEGHWTDIEYHGSSRPLSASLRAWARSLGVSFTWVRPRPRATPGRWWGKARWAQRLPMVVQAGLRLRAFVRMRRRVGGVPGWQGAASPEIVIATYFPNVETDALRRGEFRSHYWGPLHEVLDALRVPIRWIWVFSEGGGMTLDEAVAAQRAMNGRTAETGNQHQFVEAALDTAGLLRALARYGRSVVASLRFRSLTRAFRFPGSAVDFFPLLAAEWRSSLRGPGAMVAALYAEAFRATVRGLPESVRRLLYVWENQSWEHLLLDAWRADRRELAVAAVHVPGCTAQMTLRNRLGRARKADVRNLLPDRLAVPGPETGRALLGLGWPEELIVEVEALRFQHLASSHDRERRLLPDSHRRLLVLTGIQPAEARMELDLLRRAEQMGGLRRYCEVTIRPHPFCAVDALLAAVSFARSPRITQESIEALCARHDVVFSASGTSASLHAAWLGLPLIISGRVESLNLSPFKGAAGVTFVSTPSELVTQLESPRRVPIRADYFRFDPRLPRWRELLLGAAGQRPGVRA